MKLGARAGILAYILALPLFVHGAAAQNVYYRGNAIHLDQGWSADTINRWHFISQGTALLPYEWFLALEQPAGLHGTTLLSSPANMQRFGFLLEPTDQQYNRDGLPVGFDKVPIDSDQGKYACWKGNWLGLSCAVCHTGQINYHGQQIRIEGGPAHSDTESFVQQVRAAFAKIFTNPGSRDRFMQRVGASTSKDPAQSLACFVEVISSETLFNEQADASRSHSAGFGRLDAHGEGLNRLLATPLKERKNYAPRTAPVRFPALWDTPYFDWVLYNGSVRQPLARNVIEALGVQAPIKHDTMLKSKVVHAVNMDNLVWGQRALMDLRSPVWPERILGRIDPIKVSRGKRLYAMHCADCHQLIDRATHAAGAVRSGTCHEMQIPMVDLNTVGTDRQQAVAFADRKVSLARFGGPDEIDNYKAAEIVTQNIVGQWIQSIPRQQRAGR